MRIGFTGSLLFACTIALSANVAADASVFELRTYTTFEGKLDNLHARFRDHTMALFEKHGMQNVAYWTPTDKPNTLVYLISHESEDAIKPAWKAFGEDPAWRKVYADSIADGRLVANIENQFLSATEYSPAQSSKDIAGTGSARLYELRTYTTNPGKLPGLHARFGDHTIDLFGRHGIESIVYTTPVGEDAPADTLVYLISHANDEAAKASWQAFIKDPDWGKVYVESRSDGPLVIQGGIVNLFLEPTDYSPLQ